MQVSIYKENEAFHTLDTLKSMIIINDYNKLVYFAQI